MSAEPDAPAPPADDAAEGDRPTEPRTEDADRPAGRTLTVQRAEPDRDDEDDWAIVKCLHCGQPIEVPRRDGRFKCPHCGERIEATRTNPDADDAGGDADGWWLRLRRLGRRAG